MAFEEGQGVPRAYTRRTLRQATDHELRCLRASPCGSSQHRLLHSRHLALTRHLLFSLTHSLITAIAPLQLRDHLPHRSSFGRLWSSCFLSSAFISTISISRNTI